MVSLIKCSFCDEAFDSAEIYFVHLKKHTPFGTNFICNFGECYQRFSSKDSFKRHVLNHFKKINLCKNVNNILEEETSKSHCMDSENLNVDSSFCNQSSSNPPFCYTKYFETVMEFATKFVIQLHSNNNYSRSDIISLQKSIQSFIIEPICNFLENCVGNITPTIIVNDLKSLFKNVNTDYMLEKYLTEKRLIEELQVFSIDESLNAKGTLMPLHFQFEQIFTKDGLIDKVLTHMEATEKNDRKINFIQSDLWKQKKSLYPNKILIPYYLYNDDFVINNPLGSKAKNQAVCNFYYSFPCMPQNSSKLNSVFLACSILSADVKKHGNKCYDALIESIIDLEITGIEINTVTGPKKIHFIMGLMLGDNLGLNCTLGFSKSFSAKYFCRFCLIEKKDSQKAVTENEALLRNRINYREALETETPMEYGIATKSNFNNIPSFHVTENFAIDVMHDLYEEYAT
ncbi:hypothetical protein CVS40_12276 [Lucilia cuprina]|nr:hypothetical protein CVS40_12276 [Lucilia cuprina]